MSVKSIVRGFTSSITRGLAMLLTILLVFPDFQAAAQTNCVSTKWTTFNANLQNKTETFNAVVTGVTPKGVFVRVLNPPAEGILVHGEGVDVGDRLKVRLVSTDPRRGYIDFAK